MGWSRLAGAVVDKCAPVLLRMRRGRFSDFGLGMSNPETNDRLSAKPCAVINSVVISEIGVRRAKAALSSACKPQPAKDTGRRWQ